MSGRRFDKEGNREQWFSTLKSPLERYGVEALLSVVGEIEDALLYPDFPKRLVKIVTRFVPGSIVAFDEIHEIRGTYRLHHTTPVSGLELQELMAKLTMLYTQNPVHAYFTGGGKEQVLDTISLTTRAKLVKTDFYHEIFKPYGIRNQMVVRLEREGWISTLTINRDLGFDADLVSFLKALSPFLDRAQKVHQELERLRGMIPVLDAATLFTPREAEVFSWMREGKRNREIAVILACSERTVEKHIQSILKKTDTETRSGAVRVVYG